MDISTMYFIYISVLVAIVTAAFLKRLRTPKNLPPSPWSLPIIGHMHHFANGLPPHHSFRKLSRKYGDLTYLKLGEIPTVLVSSPRLAKEIMKTQDLVFASRPRVLLGEAIFYHSIDTLCSPYGEHWRQLRKIVTVELLTVKRVQSFGRIRQQKAMDMVSSIKAVVGGSELVNLSHKLAQFTSSMVMTATLGNVSKDDQDALVPLISEAFSLSSFVEISDVFPSLKILHPFFSYKGKMMQIHRDLDRVVEGIIDEHEAGRSKELAGGIGNSCEDLIAVLLNLQESNHLKISITRTTIKALLMDMFFAGTESASTTIEWAMAEMIKHPDIMAKAQSEVRNAFGERGTTLIDETEIQELKYLKLVVKETLRLHPPGPLLFPRESRQETEIDGYNIPAKTRIIVNAWAIGRDPEYWVDPDSFWPERFENSSVEFAGNHYQYIPFGSGRRMCPGVNFALANVNLVLALLLYHFNWELPNGLKPNELDMTEGLGVTLVRASNLLLLPKLAHA